MKFPTIEASASVLSPYSSAQIQILKEYLHTKTNGFSGQIPAAEVQTLMQELGVTLYQLMILFLPSAAQYAVAPISNFKVGAIGLGKSGSLYYGANQEFVNEALSFGIHGEQSATVNAIVHGETGLNALAISAAPCGYCRQFLYELNTANTLEIILPNTDPQLLTYYLPDAFGPHDLGVQGGLMDPENHNLVLNTPGDSLTNIALQAANGSYAPYSFDYAGVALQTNDGSIYVGSYAENAAFNPSMSPLEAALVNLVLSGQEGNAIARAVLVEAQGSLCSQVDATAAVLKSFGNIPLTVQFAHVGN